MSSIWNVWSCCLKSMAQWFIISISITKTIENIVNSSYPVEKEYSKCVRGSTIIYHFIRYATEHNLDALPSHDCKCSGFVYTHHARPKSNAWTVMSPSQELSTMVWSLQDLVILFCYWPKCHRKALQCIGITGWRTVNSGSGYLGSRTLTLHALCDAVCQGCLPSLFPSSKIRPPGPVSHGTSDAFENCFTVSRNSLTNDHSLSTCQHCSWTLTKIISNNTKSLHGWGL